MDIRLRILSLLVGIITLIMSFVNVRRRRLSEDFAVFWIILSSFMIFLAVKFDLIIKASNLSGIMNPNNLVFFLGIVFLVYISFYFSIKISKIERELITLLQENALLKNKKTNLDE